MNKDHNDLGLQDAGSRTQSNETREAKREKAKQRGMWQRRHRLNIVEREEFVKLSRKHGTYTGPKQ